MNSVENIHDIRFSDGDNFTVVRFDGLLEGEERIVCLVCLYQHRYVLTGLFLAVDGDHFDTCFVPICPSFVREDLKILAAFTVLYLAVPEDDGLSSPV